MGGRPSSFPEIAAEWDDEENGSLTTDQASPGSNKKSHFEVPEGWAPVGGRDRQSYTSSHGCSVCSGRQVLAATRPAMSLRVIMTAAKTVSGPGRPLRSAGDHQRDAICILSDGEQVYAPTLTTPLTVSPSPTSQ